MKLSERLYCILKYIGSQNKATCFLKRIRESVLNRKAGTYLLVSNMNTVVSTQILIAIPQTHDTVIISEIRVSWRFVLKCALTATYGITSAHSDKQCYLRRNIPGSTEK